MGLESNELKIKFSLYLRFLFMTKCYELKRKSDRLRELSPLLSDGICNNVRWKGNNMQRTVIQHLITLYDMRFVGRYSEKDIHFRHSL